MVIHTAKLLHVVGQFLIALSCIMILPLVYGLWIGDNSFPFLYSILITGIVGGLFFFFTEPTDSDLTQREGILLVFTIWIASSLFGCLPFFFSPYFTSLTDAFFESTSGFTTTGATILADVEALTNSLQFWRCLSHWLGGMGIVLLGIAILPLVGIGGMPLYRAEFSGAKSEKLKPRIIETAIALWKIYFTLTLAVYLALRWAGMNGFDAVCHAFTTIATGGFSTRTASIAAFDNAAAECIIIIFMMLAGINFTLHYRLWVERRFRSFFSDVEFRFYFIVAGAAVVSILTCLILRDQFAPLTALRRSAALAPAS